VEDVAALAVEGVYSQDDYIVDAVGPDIFTFKEMVQLIGEKIGATRPLMPFPPRLALLAAQFISLLVKDTVLTPEEVDGLMAGLLVSKDPPLGRIRLADWLEANKDKVGKKYASEIRRHYQ
jgi:NADH dehydrogenase